MKKKILAMLLTGTMAMTMLAGCGAGGAVNGKTTPKGIVDSSEPVIGYMVKGPDKSQDVKAVVVFQEGNAQLYEDTDYTFGEFAQMTDEEVLENLQAEQKAANDEKIKDYKESIADLEKTMNEKKEKGIVWSENPDLIFEHMEGESAEIVKVVLDYGYSMDTAEVFLKGENLTASWNALVASVTDMDMNAEICGMFGCTNEDIQAALAAFDAQIPVVAAEMQEDIQEEIESQQASIDDYNKKIEDLENNVAPSYKTVINMITDATGNEVSIEGVMLLDDDGVYLGLPINAHPTVYCTEGTPIYDSTYYGYSLTDTSTSYGYLFFRGDEKGIELTFDDLDTDGIFIDVEDEKDFLK